MSVTDGDREKAADVLAGYRAGPGAITDVIAAALADEREKARAPFLALAQELATLACDQHATVAGDAYAAAADWILTVAEVTK